VHFETDAKKKETSERRPLRKDGQLSPEVLEVKREPAKRLRYVGNGTRVDSGHAEIRGFEDMAAIAKPQAHPPAKCQIGAGAVDEVRSRERATCRAASNEGIGQEH
jgi:hypothetical protein